MSDSVTINLNGNDVQVESGSTIREVAKAQGIHIPTFCHDDRLKPFASCFLCVVEVEKARGLLPACSTRVAPGMVIQTDSEKVITSRKMALDLLLSDHAGDCIAPCEATCPANIDIQGYIAHIANGDFESAVHLIKKRNPLPVVCGRICPHPCESECRRGLVDEPVAINPLKRFSSEYELENGPFVPDAGPDTGKKVAIVGGGPAGLAAAYFLRQSGHAVEIFEALPELGGMARYGIPRFRMPWDILDKEIKAILDMGVTVHFNKRLGTDFTIKQLKAEGYGAVLLAIGAHKAKPMRVENENVPGVIGGVDFLRKAVLNEPIETGNSVAVIGGGDTAMDCARVARRLGVENVTLLYRRTQAEMPALPLEQEETMEEGVEFRFLTAPTEVIVENGRAKALRVITMELGEPDASGRRRPVPIEGSEEDLDFDLIIPAIGQDPDMSCLDQEEERPETTRWSTFIYDEKTQVTSQEGVFAAGDCAFGPDILIRAIGEGRRAAEAINLYLLGTKMELTTPYAISRGRLRDLDMADYSPRFIHKKRALETTFEPEKRVKTDGGWAPINAGLEQVQAMAEATRCIECGCTARFDCDLRNYSTDYGATEKKLAGHKRSYEEDKRHPLIRIESDKCITCASCVRVCDEVRGVHALTFIDRGFTTQIGPNFNDPLQDTGCDACGMCIDVCPTGTISANTGKETGPWVWDVTQSTCTGCARGCGLAVHVARGHIVKIGAIDNDPVNGAVICAEGRFGYQLMAKRGNRSLNGQMSSAQTLLAKGGTFSIIVSSKLTVEEAYGAAQLAKQHRAGLYYVAGGAVQSGGKPLSKIRGEANVALLTRLGATAWNPATVSDVVVLVNTQAETPNTESANIIAISAHDVGSPAGLHLPIADVLETEGAFLNRDGNLGLLGCGLADPGDQAGYRVLARLAGLDDLTDLGNLRRSLVDEVPELKGLISHEGSSRIVKTDLSPELTAAAMDNREAAFATHMAQLKLPWG
ncbi:MAG: FAD-dependent oxidoreductase [Magnetococcales bacterium]|nr:FAD-dependent oxidoreductase [Magnetococcales bacterium]